MTKWVLVPGTATEEMGDADLAARRRHRSDLRRASAAQGGKIAHTGTYAAIEALRKP